MERTTLLEYFRIFSKIVLYTLRLNTRRYVQSFLKIHLKESKFFLDRSICVVFLLGSAKFQPMLPMKIQRILPQKLIRFAVISNIIGGYV